MKDLRCFVDLSDIDILIGRDELFGTLGITQVQEQSFEFQMMADYYYDKPVEFAEDFLFFIADDKQKEIMKSIRDNKRTAVRSGQGIGKTATISCIIIWYLCTRYNSKIICTAPNITQLYTVMWAEIAKWLQNSPISNFITHTKTRLYMNGYEKNWFAFPKTATTKEGIAGQHADHLLVIADEASGIKDDILETLLGTITGEENKLLFISNPTRTSGVYYNAFHQNRSMFNCIHVNSENSIRVDRENIDMLAKSYGKDSNVYRVRVLGEFPSQEDDVFIPMEWIERSVAKESRIYNAEEVQVIKIGVDVARFGDDESSIAPNIENEINQIFTYKHNKTTTLTGKVINLVESYYNTYSKAKIFIIVDEIGVGGGVVDRLVELLETDYSQLSNRIEVIACNVSRSSKSKKYADMTTFLWGNTRNLLENNELKLPNDNELIGQLSCRKYEVLSNGKLEVESKKKMKKRGLKSPDRADSIVLSCAPINLNTDDRSTGKRS